MEPFQSGFFHLAVSPGVSAMSSRDLGAHVLLVLSDVPLSGRVAVCVSIRLVGDIVGASKLW